MSKALPTTILGPHRSRYRSRRWSSSAAPHGVSRWGPRIVVGRACSFTATGFLILATASPVSSISPYLLPSVSSASCRQTTAPSTTPSCPPSAVESRHRLRRHDTSRELGEPSNRRPREPPQLPLHGNRIGARLPALPHDAAIAAHSSVIGRGGCSSATALHAIASRCARRTFAQAFDGAKLEGATVLVCRLPGCLGVSRISGQKLHPANRPGGQTAPTRRSGLAASKSWACRRRLPAPASGWARCW